jgi:hypothetical protein
MIRVLLGAGSAAAANGMTADVDVLLDAGAAGSAGDNFTVDTTIDAGAATGEGVSAGLDQTVGLSIIGGIDPDATAYIAAVEAADDQNLEPEIKTAYYDFVVGCKDDGIWDAIKASCILAGARTLDGALVPLVGPAPTKVNLVSGDYDRKTGIKGNGSNKYLDTNRNHNLLPQDNNHMCAYTTELGTPGSEAGTMIGTGSFQTSGTTEINYAVKSGDPTTYEGTRFRNMSSSGFINTSPFFTEIGFHGVSRNVSTSYNYRHPPQAGTRSTTSQAPAGGNVFVLRANSFVNNYSGSRVCFYSMGEFLDLALLKTRLDTLVSDIDAAIP